MKQLLVVATILTSALNNVCAEEHEAKVSVRQPLVVLVRRVELPTVCATKARVEACTATAGQVLTCRCRIDRDGWQIEATAQFIPVMYVLGAEHVTHERAHIRDIEQSIKTYLDGRASQRFETESACEIEAEAMSATFPSMMERFKDDSNVLRHGEAARRLAAR